MSKNASNRYCKDSASHKPCQDRNNRNNCLCIVLIDSVKDVAARFFFVKSLSTFRCSAMLYLCQSRLCPTCGRVHNLKLIIIMTINRGCLKVPRALFYAEEWQSKRRFSRFEAVVSLLEQASYVDGRQMQLTGGTVRLRRGQFVTTVRSLAEQWGWKKDSTARFLNNMVHRGLIRVETVTVKGATDNEADDAPCCATIRATTATCITVCNNDADEGDGDGCATACRTQSATTNATACETNIYNEENKELQECGKAGVKECVKGEKGLAHTPYK